MNGYVRLVAALDANVVISGAITSDSVPRQILDALVRGSFLVVASPESIAEIERVLRRPSIQVRLQWSPAEAEELLDRLRRAVVQPLEREQLPVHCRDPKDDMVLAFALGGNADYLVTGDADLLVLDGHAGLGKLRILTPRAFLDVLEDAPPT